MNASLDLPDASTLQKAFVDDDQGVDPQARPVFGAVVLSVILLTFNIRDFTTVPLINTPNFGQEVQNMMWTFPGVWHYELPGLAILEFFQFGWPMGSPLFCFPATWHPPPALRRTQVVENGGNIVLGTFCILYITTNYNVPCSVHASKSQEAI